MYFQEEEKDSANVVQMFGFVNTCTFYVSTIIIRFHRERQFYEIASVRWF